MGHLGILGAIVPAASKKEINHGTGSLWIILKCVTIPTNIYFAFEFCTSIYIEISTAHRA